MEDKEVINRVAEYSGNSKFIKDVKNYLSSFNNLTPRQITACRGIFEGTNTRLDLKWKIDDNKVCITSFIGSMLNEKFKLGFDPDNITVSLINVVTSHAISFNGYFSNGNLTSRVFNQIWIPKSQILSWDGKFKHVIKMI